MFHPSTDAAPQFLDKIEICNIECQRFSEFCALVTDKTNANANRGTAKTRGKFNLSRGPPFNLSCFVIKLSHFVTPVSLW